MRDCNYATLADFQPWPDIGPGWFMLEWDIALDQHERTRFEQTVSVQPGRVHVAPYRLPTGQQVHRNNGVPIADGTPDAEMFGFGCIYFPQAVLDLFWSEPPKRLVRTGELTDTVFSDWHRQRFAPAVVDWTVRPQHLHGD